jgi:uncharacterized OB-fold protein
MTDTAAVAVRPLPIWDPDTEGFWIAARDHVLAVKQCQACGYTTFPPWPTCRSCSSLEFAWRPTSGRGRIFTWTTVFVSTRPEFKNDVPYTLAVVDLDDFPVRIPARLRGVAPLQAKIGGAVSAGFEDVTAEVSLLHWLAREEEQK